MAPIKTGSVQANRVPVGVPTTSGAPLGGLLSGVGSNLSDAEAMVREIAERLGVPLADAANPAEAPGHLGYTEALRDRVARIAGHLSAINGAL